MTAAESEEKAWPFLLWRVFCRGEGIGFFLLLDVYAHLKARPRREGRCSGSRPSHWAIPVTSWLFDACTLSYAKSLSY